MIQRARLAFATAALLATASFGSGKNVAVAFAPVPIVKNGRHHHVMVLEPTKRREYALRFSSLRNHVRSFQVSRSTNECKPNEGKREKDSLRHWWTRLEPLAQEETGTLQELLGMVIFLLALSSFVLVNQFVEPWPEQVLWTFPAPFWLLLHYLGGILFAGGVVVTTALEWLVVGSAAQDKVHDNDIELSSPKRLQKHDQHPNKVAPVLSFLFDRVPMLDACLVLPGLVVAIVSGVAVATQYYGSLANSPGHIQHAFRLLVAFCAWWATTDVSTQAKAAQAVQEWNGAQEPQEDLPSILYMRRISNVGSCLFVVAFYVIMALKPGTHSF